MAGRTVYLNGEYVSPDYAKVSSFDRGLLFGDGVYAVAGVLAGKLLDFDHHMERLERSLAELDIPQPLTRDEVLAAFRKMVQLNGLREGLVYLQVTRGQAERDFVYDPSMKPTTFMFTQAKDSEETDKLRTGVSLLSVPDLRWARRDIKSVNLLGSVLAKQAAKEAGAYEALLVGSEGYVTECGATSFYLFRNNTIITRPLSREILPGVTRRAVVDLCLSNQLGLEERLFTLEEALEADEAFITGASTYVLPVTRIDDHQIGTGQPGPATLALRQIYLQHARETAI